MSELVDWLRAQLDLDNGRGDVDLAADTDLDKVHHLDCDLWFTAGYHGRCTCGYRDRWARELAAKRRIVDECARTLEFEDYGLPLADHVLRLLALPYADRPGYRDEWRPDA